MNKTSFVKNSVVFVLLLAAFVYSANVVAVLEITPVDETVDLKITEFRHLTDELRTRAREALPEDYTVLTRDNIISLMPSDEEEAECLADGCAVAIGRAIGAEYVTQGFVGRFGDMFTLTVEFYESMSGNMLGSFVTESNNIMGLLGAIREKAPSMFAKIKQSPVPKPEPVVPVLLSEAPADTLKQRSDVASEAAKDAVKGAGGEGSGGFGWRGWTRVAAYTLTAGCVGMAIFKHVKAEDYNDKVSKLEADFLKSPSRDDYGAWRRNYMKKVDAADINEKQRLAYSIGAGVSALVVAFTFVF